MRPLLDSLDVTPKPLPWLVFLGRHPLPVGQQRLVLAQVHDHVRTIKSSYRPTNDVPYPVLEFGENQLLFCPPDVLHQRLLGILGGNPPEPYGRHLYLDLLADLGVGFDPSRVEHRNLVVR